MKRLALSLPVLVLLAGCGGGVSKADYLPKAESVCKKANADQKALKTPSGLEDVPPYVDKLVAIADKATKDLNALDVPKDDEKDLKAKFLEPLGKQVDEGRAFGTKVRKAVASKDVVALQKLLTDAPTMTKADLTWMKAYGFKECVTAADTES